MLLVEGVKVCNLCKMAGTFESVCYNSVYKLWRYKISLEGVCNLWRCMLHLQCVCKLEE